MKHQLEGLVEQAMARLADVVPRTALELNLILSERFNANVYFKRMDQTPVRSYKLYGAFNRISLLSSTERRRGIVCASAGNHAQGFAWSCQKLKIKGCIYMPKNTPRQKINRVRSLGGEWVTLSLVGDTFDDACGHALAFTKRKDRVFIHPFEDLQVIAGQGIVGLEILEQLPKHHRLDFVVVPVGGGGLIAGLGSYVKSRSPKTRLVGVEPVGAPSMSKSLLAGRVVTLETIDKFVDGAAVRTVGQLNFEIARNLIYDMQLVSEGQVCQTMIELYQNNGIVTEPAGALSVAVLEQIKSAIKGKTVVCVVSGGNNDLSRYPEIVERSLMHQGLKHYFLIEFPQRPRALKKFLDEVLGPDTDITRFEYTRKNARESGPALVGIELSHKEHLQPLLARMSKAGFSFEHLQQGSAIFRLLI